MLCIGIDPGTHTGVAVWDTTTRQLSDVATMPVHRALKYVENLHALNEIEVVFEDARLRKWYGKGNTYAKLQGAGSIKRDSAIWEDFCTDLGISFKLVSPGKVMTKASEEYFQLLTGWKGRTSNHARDAAMLVIGR